MTIAEFLLARIADDLVKARTFKEHDASSEYPSYYLPGSLSDPDRWIAEGQAKRQIIEAAGEIAGLERDFCERAGLDPDDFEQVHARGLLVALASVYADHADFDEAWRL